MTPSLPASTALYDFLRGWEGIDGGMPALGAYLDSGGVATIGYGHTHGVRLGDSCSQQQAGDWLMEDLAPVVNQVNAMVGPPLEQYRFDALLAFAFNLGTQALRSSTLLKQVNGADYVAAALEFPRWDHAGGKELAGLLKRRVAEMHMFLSGDYSARP